MAYIDSGGVRLYAQHSGSGAAIVWLHEFAADFRTWESQVRRFSRDYRCITYNARGYPPSDVPDSDDAYTYERQRDDLRAVLDGLGVERAHIVGLSMGAYTGLQFALSDPDRVTSLLFASGGSGSFPGDRAQFAADCDDAANRMLLEGMESAANGLALGPTRVQLLNKDRRGWLEFKGYLAEHSAQGSAMTLRNFQGIRPSIFDFESDLERLEVPVLLAVGDEDDPVIEANLFLKRTLPRAGLWVYPKTGHGINLEEPEAFNEMAARFFAAVDGGRWGPRDPRSQPGHSVFMGDRLDDEGSG
jgi:pimeloyl-ACP methyl ester carboxylesterase